MIPEGQLSKNLSTNKYKVDFSLIGFVDADTRNDMPEAGYLSKRAYEMEISEEQMAHIIDYLGLYPHVKSVDPDFADAEDII